MSVSRRMAWNTATIWVNSLTAAVVALAIVPLLQEHLGRSAYGLVVVMTTIVTMSTMADLGLRGALARHLSAEVARGDQRRVNELFSATMSWLLSVGAFMGAVCWIGAPRFVAWLDVPTELESGAIFLVRYYVAIQVATWLVAPIFGGVLESHHRFDITNLVHTAEVLFRGALLVAAVAWADLGVYGWFLAMTLSRLTTLVVLMAASWRVCPYLRYQPFRFQFSTFRDLATLGGLVFLYWAVFRLSVLVDPLILGKLLDMDAAALYEPARLAMASAFPFIAALQRQLNPMAAGYHATGQVDRLSDVLIRGTRWTLFLSIPFVVTFGCFADPIIRLAWLGEGFEVTARCLAWWAVAELLFYANGSQWQVMMGVGRIRVIVWVEFVMALVNMAASIACVAYLRDAGWGDMAVLGVLFPTIGVRLVLRVVLTIYTARVVGMPLKRYLIEGYARVLGVLSALAIVAWLVREAIDPSSLLSLIGCILVPALLWIPCSWWLVFDESDRARIVGLIKWAAAMVVSRGAPTSDG